MSQPLRRGTVRARWRRYGERMWTDAMHDNLDQIRQVVAAEADAKGSRDIVDLGCWDGATTSKYVPDGCRVIGVEMSAEAGQRAAERGWKVVQADLNERIPLEDCICDVVTSNQVIEHLSDTDRFVSETYRLLQPGGMAVISTENLASWHNIVSLLLGWQAFSLSNVSALRPGLGNPIALWHDAAILEDRTGWYHQRIFSYRGLQELATAVGFTEVRVFGAGYYPLRTSVAHRDPRHAAFITLVGRKP
jgi:SAM-dependent methyltransferase